MVNPPRNRQPTKKFKANEANEVELAQRASRQFTGKKKATKAPKTKAVAPKKAVAVAAAAGKDVTVQYAANLAAKANGVVHTGSSTQTVPKRSGRTNAASAASQPQVAQAAERAAVGTGAWLHKQAVAERARTAASRAAPVVAAVAAPVVVPSASAAPIIATGFRNPARGKKLPPFPATIVEPSPLADPPIPEDSDLDDEDLYRHQPRIAVSSSRRIREESDADEDDEEVAQDLGPESEDDGDHHLIRVELDGDINMDDEPAMLAQAVRNSKEPHPLLDFYGDGGISEGGAPTDASDEEVYEVNANGKRLHGRAPRNTKQPTNRPPKAADYDPHTKQKVLLACSILTAIGVAEDPFPSNEATIEMAGSAWDTALEMLDAFPVDEAVEWYAIMARAFPQFRGHVRDRVRPKIPEAYGFDERPRRVEHNRALYLRLVEGDAFICEDPKNQEGYWFNAILYKGLKASFFSSFKDKGLAHQQYFNPIRPQTIAFLFTTVRLCLDEWRTGSFSPIEFKTGVYGPVYRDLLANLLAVEAADARFTRDLGEDLYTDLAAPFSELTAASSAVSHSTSQINKTILYAQERRARRAVEDAAANAE